MIYYVENFIDSIEMSNYCKDLAKVLLKNKEDCEMFFENCLGKNNHIFDDLLDYREMKLSDRNISIDDFISMCNNNDKIAIFEIVFLQPIKKKDMRYIEDLINNGEITLKEIYYNFQRNMNINILKNVL